MLRTTTHPVTSAHYASFLPDVGKRDVCIVFDFRCYERDDFELTMHAHARGAKTVVIRHPDPWFSQAAEVADLVLPVAVDGLRPFDSVVPATAIVDSLVAGIRGNLGERADRRIREAMS
jgi:DNA-binding MurR/RpiR family transcriptional regulator